MTSIPIDFIRQTRTLWTIAAVSAFRLCGYNELLFVALEVCCLTSNAGQITSVVPRLEVRVLTLTEFYFTLTACPGD